MDHDTNLSIFEDLMILKAYNPLQDF